jgi:hypothetical protein
MNKVDILFILDITGSMGNLIIEAKKSMKDILDKIVKEYSIDLKVGLSLYRDHPTQDSSFVTTTYKLNNVEDTVKIFDIINAAGGGDTPEAVIDGVIDGITDMEWRENSRRVAFLIGDAPAHGMCNNENCCLCGKTWGDAISIAQSKEVTIYSIVLGGNIEAQNNFKTLAVFSGGLYIKTDDAIGAVFNTLKVTMEELSIKR